MKKIMIAAVAALGTCVAFASEELEESVFKSQNWRISAGFAARGSMEAEVGNRSKSCEAYGVDLDLQYKAISVGDFNLWTGIGGSYMPNQRMAKASFSERDASDPDITIDYGGRGSLDVSCTELRLMLVPEWQITERWAIGARVGVAFDWLKGTVKTSTWSNTNIHIPGLPETVIPVGPSRDKDHMTDFVTQAIIGLETTYMLFDNLGLYANIDYRCGEKASFESHGEDYCELDMDGWYAGAGIVVAF